LEATPFPIDQPFDQVALSYIAQITGTGPDSLSLVETSTVLLPIMQVRLWNGILVHPNENGGDVYSVLIDADQRIILNGLNFNPQTYWEEAESSFRQANRDAILSQISRQNDIPAAELSIVNGVLHSYPLTQIIVWKGIILSKSGDEFHFAVSLDGKPVDLWSIEAQESEARRLKYGKLGEKLYYILQAIPDDRSVEVALATAGSDLGEIAEKLKADFPEIKAAHFAGGIPVDSEGKLVEVDRETLDKIRERYLEYLSQGTIEPKIPVLNYLKELGYEPRDVTGANVIDARMTKTDILLLSQAPLDSLGSILYNGQIPQP